MLKIIDRIFDYIFVPKCGGCHCRMDRQSVGLCEKCKNVYQDERAEYCDFCGMEAAICRCVPPALLVTGCYDYRKLVFYKKSNGENVMHNMIYGIKRSNNRSLAKLFAREMLALDDSAITENAIVTYAPRAMRSVKKYGYDHAKMLAAYYAKLGGYEFKTLLRRKVSLSQKQQKLLNYKQRAKNVKGAFAVCNEDAISGKTVILIDDVVTSGATMGECTDTLYAAGAKNVICRSIAYTYKKNKCKND